MDLVVTKNLPPPNKIYMPSYVQCLLFIVNIPYPELLLILAVVGGSALPVYSSTNK